MATYKWRVPIVQAVQFTGENHDEVKALIGDTSEGEEFLVGTGEFEEPKEPKPKEAKKPKEHELGKPKEHEKHEKVEASKPETKLGETKPVPEDEASEVPPTGVPYDPKAKPTEGPVEKKEPLKVAEGDWVVKWTHDGKIETNPEGFPQEYEFVSA